MLDFPAPFRELLSLIDAPFLHLITDYPPAERTCFLGGKVRLVGDAVTLMRPHAAFSTNQAAAHAALMGRWLDRGETAGMSEREWEYQVAKSAELHWARSIWYGEYLQNSSMVSAVWHGAVRYWLLAAGYWVRYWCGWVDRPVT